MNALFCLCSVMHSFCVSSPAVFSGYFFWKSNHISCLAEARFRALMTWPGCEYCRSPWKVGGPKCRGILPKFDVVSHFGLGIRLISQVFSLCFDGARGILSWNVVTPLLFDHLFTISIVFIVVFPKAVRVCLSPIDLNFLLLLLGHCLPIEEHCLPVIQFLLAFQIMGIFLLISVFSTMWPPVVE